MARIEKILFISRDPGGTNQLVALRDILLGETSATKKELFNQLNLSSSPDITVIAKDFAKGIWRQNDLDALDWPEVKSEPEVEAYLSSLCPDQIVTSTCHVDDRTEQVIWRAAKRLGIKTTAFLDSGLNISVRFTNDRGKVVLPDRVSVIDEKTTPPLLSLGLERQAIFPSGDLFRGYTKRMAARVEKGKLCADWGAKPSESLILFASDYVQEMQARGLAFEVTEFDCLNLLIDLLTSGDITRYHPDSPKPYRLIIRPHPKDTPGKYDNYPEKSSEYLTIVIRSRGSSTEAILSSDAVAGLGSSLLHEAKVLGVKIIELGPIVSFRKDPLKTVE